MAKKGKKGKASKGKGKGKGKSEAPDSIEQILDEMYYMGPGYNEKRKVKYRRKINDAFKVFERQSDNGSQERVCDFREVKTIVRSLDLNPTKAQLENMLDEMRGTESSAFIQYDRLEDLLLKVLMTKEYIPKSKAPLQEGEVEEPQSTMLVRHTEDQIIDAFRVFDSTNRGEIEADAFGNLMVKNGRAGEDFEPEEVLDMIQAAADPDTGLVKYEESLYVDQLANE
ncbi:Calmodulin [Diplonema papillatum]|nr:Calmodulin [Diplonema papillatum]